MQHRYPFACLNFDFELHEVDVNVHPTKQEVRFSNRAEVYQALVNTISDSLRTGEDINTVDITEEKEEEKKPAPAPEIRGAEPFETKRLLDVNQKLSEKISESLEAAEQPIPTEAIKEKEYTYEQQVFLTPENVKKHRIIGQVFDTFWLVEFDDCLYMIDQHAAHEKVLYERTMERIRDMKVSAQHINPPILISLSEADKNLLFENRESFGRLGYEFDDFGQGDIALTAIPQDLFGIEPKGLFLDMVGDLSDISVKDNPQLILERIASMSCKAAVKGHDHLSMREIETLISDLLSLEDPYHCPHGRPTIIRMTHYELDKKFKRIV